MDEMKLKAALRAIEALEELLDSRDAEDGKKLKEEDSGADMPEDSPKEPEKPMDAPAEEPKGFDEELAEMADKQPGAKSVLDLLKDDKDEDEDDGC